ncbi:MAG: glycine--tRNA ligase subunit beta [Clostridia bacterium]|nr:glycine--tRNA ligase subunit beta [Clostridia bacterium]
MADYLLEIGTEEIPAKFMSSALVQLKDLAAQKLQAQRLKYKTIRTMGTPRRLALLVEDLAEQGEDLKEEVRGPARKVAFDSIGKPTKAALGFARSQGVAVENLVVQETKNGAYLFALKEVKGRAAAQVLAEIAPQLIQELNFPKTMRWGEEELHFARPIRWLVSLLDEQIIPLQIAGLYAGRITRGHRFLGEERIIIKHPQVYQELLKENYVLVDQEVREKECWRQISEIADEVQGKVEQDQKLLEEVTYLLEWPTALLGCFSEEYLSLPEEVVITPMREQQRYFPVRDQEGNLLNRFITVRNGTSEHLDLVRVGNERVLKARLADAHFFWTEDLKVKLADYLPRLEKVVFQESLGTVAQKAIRMEKIVEQLAKKLQLKNIVAQNACRAARLTKADLVTNMVGEFPELQGIMGYYYALHSGEKKAVAQAISEHYRPRFTGDVLPVSLEGALVSIADKIDTLVGCFAIGIEPTGSQDPYALRRQAMGVCQILLAHQLEVSVDELIILALNNYQGLLSEKQLGKHTEEKIKQFLQIRLKNILSEKGHKYDVIEAVLAVEYAVPLTTMLRAEALSQMRNREDFKALLTSFTRAYNLTKKNKGGKIKPSYFEDETEKELYEALAKTAEQLQSLLAVRDFQGIIVELSKLAGYIDDFFVAVMVMTEDEELQKNRLGLLAWFVILTQNVGDLSKIVNPHD